MLMNKEDADAWAEQQAGEIRNLKAVKKDERRRIQKIIESYKKKSIKGSFNETILKNIIRDIHSQKSYMVDGKPTYKDVLERSRKISSYVEYPSSDINSQLPEENRVRGKEARRHSSERLSSVGVRFVEASVDNHNQHPKVIACQGEGETMVKSLDVPKTDDGVGTSSRNPSADTYNQEETKYKKTLQKGINLLKNNPNAIVDILQVSTRLSYLRGRLFEQKLSKSAVLKYGEKLVEAMQPDEPCAPLDDAVSRTDGCLATQTTETPDKDMVEDTSTTPADTYFPKGFKKGKCRCGNYYGYCGIDIGYCVKCIDGMIYSKKNSNKTMHEETNNIDRGIKLEDGKTK